MKRGIFGLLLGMLGWLWAGCATGGPGGSPTPVPGLLQETGTVPSAPMVTWTPTPSPTVMSSPTPIPTATGTPTPRPKAALYNFVLPG